MELSMTNGFKALSFNEMEEIDGGNWIHKFVGITYMTVGAVATIANPALAPAGAVCFEFGFSCLL